HEMLTKGPLQTEVKGELDIMGTRWSVEWLDEDGKLYVSDKVTFSRWVNKNQFEGYGEVTHHGKEYKYSITGEVSRAGVVIVYKAEKFPTEGNIGTACLQLSIGAETLVGKWSGFASVPLPDGSKTTGLRSGKVTMQKIKDLDS